ncbi:uncharacterized protein RHOBADRAFT_52565 [Rhodotorula graminis WP1]|uniref:F-box domain-containing protein n=1 Tax=Rhodotorula graminis (strain WP1) TaxID=578459 RepID=A0A194SB01_RHOGW|nr:uncharacterized protein RHOBADRAFT_52565 [Rhodotorula graminis WP1]KPV76576.1 hypothetical protein RHOBADRAFT_52565 [Rhodotorula graminis WP1]
MTARLSVFGLEGMVGPAPASPASPSEADKAQPMQRRRSRSATRVLEEARPQREEVVAPVARGVRAPSPRRDTAVDAYYSGTVPRGREPSSSSAQSARAAAGPVSPRATPTQRLSQHGPPRAASQNVLAGLAPSSSFWSVDAASLPPSGNGESVAPPRRESLQARAVYGRPQTASSAREMSRARSVGGEDMGSRAQQRRESLAAAASLAQEPGQADLDSRARNCAPSQLDYSLGPPSSFAGRPTLPPGAAPPQPVGSAGSYDRLAALYGPPIAATSSRSATSLAETTTTSSPVTLFTRQVSNDSGSDGSATTPGASDSEQSDELDAPVPLKPLVAADDLSGHVTPRQLPRAPAPPASQEVGGFPSPVRGRPLSSAPALPLPRPASSVSSQSTVRSPTSPRIERSSLPPSRLSDHVEVRNADTPTKLVKRRSSTFAPPAPPVPQPIVRPPLPPSLSAASPTMLATHTLPSKSRAARPITPPKSPDRARKALFPAPESTATSPPPRRSSLIQGTRSAIVPSTPRASVPPSLGSASQLGSSTSPSRQWRESPTTPRSRVVDEQPSPTKRIGTSGALTPRAAALAAAREREKKLASSNEAPALISSHAPISPPLSDHGSPIEQVAPVKPVEPVVEDRSSPRVELAFALYPLPILRSLLRHINYADIVSLQLVSRTLRRAVEVDSKELVLERFLGAYGYRSLARQSAAPTKAAGFLPSSASDIVLDLRDLSAFRAALRVSFDEHAHLARVYTHDPARFSQASLRLARATTRAWNRVVLRLRLQTTLPSSSFAAPTFPELPATSSPVYKTGRAPSLRVWVPTRNGESWMADGEVIECEREVWRSSGAWAQLRRGDVVANVAIPAFGNVGTLVFDGKFLRDLSFEHDVVGHLPAWLNMLGFSPSHFHNIIVASSSNPVFYLSLAPYVDAVRESLVLCKDRVAVSSPQGNYLVSRYVYRAALRLLAGQMIGDVAGAGGAGPGGIEVVHPDWAGEIVVETEGTTEAATLLLARVASAEPVPWRILREKSRPGRVWLKPVVAGGDNV